MAKLLKVIVSIAAVLIFALTGCVSNEQAQTGDSSEPAGEIINIVRGTVGNIYNISIGLGDTGTSEYVDRNGVKQKALVARLTLYDDIDKVEKGMTVYVGQSFEFHDYTFFVKEIKATHLFFNLPGASGGGSIRLIVSPE